MMTTWTTTRDISARWIFQEKSIVQKTTTNDKKIKHTKSHIYIVGGLLRRRSRGRWCTPHVHAYGWVRFGALFLGDREFYLPFKNFLINYCDRRCEVSVSAFWCESFESSLSPVFKFLVTVKFLNRKLLKSRTFNCSAINSLHFAKIFSKSSMTFNYF